MTMTVLKFWMRTGLLVLAGFALTSPPLNGGKASRTLAEEESILLTAGHEEDPVSYTHLRAHET